MKETLQNIIGHDFKDQALLETAITHSSAGFSTNYERLEFLGDRVLGLAIAEVLYKKFPDEPEGDMAKRLAALVQGTMLACIAKEINLGRFITFSDAEREAGGAENENILADVMEAIIGAIYLDGGFVPCRKMVESLWGKHLDSVKKPPAHPKTALQEWAQGRGLALPLYAIAGQSGPDHAPVFDVSLKVEGFEPVQAEGRSRQDAERKAAQAFMALHSEAMQ